MSDTLIKSDDYEIHYTPEGQNVVFRGSLRLSGSDEYQPIVDLLEDMLNQQPPEITLDLRELDFLNSSGINILSKFVINVRKRNTIAVVVKGSKSVPWQGKSLKNLQRLMPSLQLLID